MWEFVKLSLLFLVGLGVMGALIGELRHRKWFQSIYHLSPESHQLKSKTPTLGGVGIMVVILLGMALFFFEWTMTTWWLCILMGSFCAIGLVDDVMSMKLGKNKGLSPKHKLILQGYMALLGVGAYAFFVSLISFWEGVFYWVVMIGASNATNLTDGLDGLLGGSMMISLIGFLMVGWVVFPGDVLLFIGVVISALMAFLIYNRYPAKVFMGDTGSLAMGALLVGIAMIYGNVWVLLSLGVVYIIETVSVIIQVAWYKRTKRRLFLMAPLHHHFEQLGLKEQYVVTLFWGIGIVGGLISLMNAL